MTNPTYSGKQIKHPEALVAPVRLLTHEFFEQQAQKNPDNTALFFNTDSLTYAQLNERSNHLAHYLTSLGIKAEDRVALVLDPSFELLISIFAVLKAGAAYVPIDPTTPLKRIEFILKDTSARILLISPGYKNIFKKHAIHILALSFNSSMKTLFGWEKPFSSPVFLRTPLNLNEIFGATNLHIDILPRQLAYIIYTSGSSGTPKGVCIEHASLANYLLHIRDNCSFTEGGSLLHSSVAFDMSVTSLFLNLIQGNSLYILSKTQTPLESLSVFLEQNKLNALKLTPSHLKAFKKSLSIKASLVPKGSLFLGGESLSWEDIDSFFSSSDLSVMSIFNHYGPTEACVGCCIFPIPPHHRRHSSTVPIGKPISNTHIYLLTVAMDPVGNGETGELYIGGAGLARGYLNQPSLTAERFVPNPFLLKENFQSHKNPQSLRLYRTGDLGRYLPDGTIELLGRTDEQIKIKGYRIECGEVEKYLNTHSKILTSAVFSWKDPSGINKLVTYLVPTIRETNKIRKKNASSLGNKVPILRGPTLAALSETLRKHVEKSLPSYMVPSYFIFTESIPLTTNGKIDKKDLHEHISLATSSPSRGEEPDSHIEKKLSIIWSSVFNLPSIGMHTNFFSLGGDSIISLQLIAQAKTQGILFSAMDVLSYPTIAALSRVSRLTLPPSPQRLVPCSPHGSFPLTPIQSWFFKRNLRNINHYNQAVYLNLSPGCNLTFIHKAFELIIEAHPILQCKYKPKTPGTWDQQLNPSEGTVFSWKVIDLSNLSSSDSNIHIEKLTPSYQASLNIAEGPLLSVVAFNLGSKEPPFTDYYSSPGY